MTMKARSIIALCLVLVIFLGVYPSRALDIANFSRAGSTFTLDFSASTSLSYWVERADHPTGSWSVASDDCGFMYSTGLLSLASAQTSAFFRLQGQTNVKTSVTIEKMRGIQKALEAFRLEYGQYPPVNSMEYEYEDAAQQDAYLRDFYFFDNRGIVEPKRGLVSYLWPRNGTLHEPFDGSWYTDTSRDGLAKMSWESFLTGMLNVAFVPYSITPTSGPMTELYYTNKVETVRDAWTNELKYLSKPPYLTYSLWSTRMPDGIFKEQTPVIISGDHSDAQDYAVIALSNAIAAVDADLDDGLTVYVYPPWDVLVSSHFSTDPYTPLSGGSVTYLPYHLVAVVEGTTPYWLELKDAMGFIIGRYTYAVVNCSGLLDANTVGGAVRSSGTSPREIQLDVLGDIGLASIFLADRTNDGVYATVPELGSGNIGLSTGWPSNFVAYSRSYEGQFANASYQASNKVDISGDVAALQQPAKRLEIVAALENAGIAALQTAFVYSNLIDYVDGDCIPHALDNAYTEAVPMISEVFVTNRVLFAGDVACQSFLSVEWHYPFIKPSTNSFNLHVELKSTFQNFSVGSTTTDISTATVACDYNPGVDTEMFYILSNIVDIAQNLPGSIGDNVRAGYEVKAWITEAAGGQMVDAAPYPTNTYVTLDNVDATVPGAGWVSGSAGRECVDPRFNWHNNQWYPSLSGPTLGTTNEWMLTFFASQSGLDQGIDMHVSDAGRLSSVGELGNLLQSGSTLDRFKTIKLYDSARDGGSAYSKHAVLNYFTLTNGTHQGLVNLNSTNTEVLAAVFQDAPIDYPGSGKALNTAQRDAIANAIASDSSVFWDVADIGSLGSTNWDEIAGLTTMTDLERESIISHSAGLFTVRHNLFTILIHAEAYSEGMGQEPGAVKSSANLVARVWRDPFRDGLGDHEIIFSWINTSLGTNLVGEAIINHIADELTWTMSWPPDYPYLYQFTDEGKGIRFNYPGQPSFDGTNGHHITYSHDVTNKIVTRTEQRSSNGWGLVSMTLATNVQSLMFSSGADIEVSVQAVGETNLVRNVTILGPAP